MDLFISSNWLACLSKIQLETAFNRKGECDFVFLVLSVMAGFALCILRRNFNSKLLSGGWWHTKPGMFKTLLCFLTTLVC